MSQGAGESGQLEPNDKGLFLLSCLNEIGACSSIFQVCAGRPSVSPIGSSLSQIRVLSAGLPISLVSGFRF